MRKTNPTIDYILFTNTSAYQKKEAIVIFPVIDLLGTTLSEYLTVKDARASHVLFNVLGHNQFNPVLRFLTESAAMNNSTLDQCIFLLSTRFAWITSSLKMLL